MNNPFRIKSVLPAALVALSLLVPARAKGEVDPAAKPSGLAPAAIFSDHMVLQRQAKVPVWGTTAPGGTVIVTFKGQTKTATAGQDGKWMVRLDEMEAQSEPQEMTVKDAKETRVFKDVVVGDVWLGSGQSNMEFGWTFR